MGEHRSIPQADSMAMLLDHGSNVEIDAHPLRRQ